MWEANNEHSQCSKCVCMYVIAQTHVLFKIHLLHLAKIGNHPLRVLTSFGSYFLPYLSGGREKFSKSMDRCFLSIFLEMASHFYNVYYIDFSKKHVYVKVKQLLKKKNPEILHILRLLFFFVIHTHTDICHTRLLSSGWQRVVLMKSELWAGTHHWKDYWVLFMATPLSSTQRPTLLIMKQGKIGYLNNSPKFSALSLHNLWKEGFLRYDVEALLLLTHPIIQGQGFIVVKERKLNQKIL